MKKTLLFSIIFTLVASANLLQAQQWHYYNPFLWFDVNCVDIPEPGIIAAGGGHESHDSIQVMFQSSDYGLTWSENVHDGLAPWNKSIAFSDSLTGYGVGDHGRIIKSNDAGLNWGWPVNPIDRSLNKIIFVPPSKYYIAGGKKANDSIQTILMSTDSGNTWSVIYDTLGPWLKSIYFTDTLKGFAVGDNGVILTTTNGGNSWSSMIAPIQRDFNAITFINADTGYIVGGVPVGLCRRTILRTTNGGLNWNVIADTTGGILKDVSFADQLVGYAVGDSATVLQTSDGGLNWLSIVIDSNLADSASFNAVKFKGRYFGAIGGKAGELYIYYNPYPIVATSLATNISFSSAKLNGTVDAFGIPTSIKFEYGTTTSYGSEIDAIPDSSFSIGNINAYAIPTGLTPNTIYHFRIIASSSIRTNFGNDMIFYSGYPEIPNFNFEIWDTADVEIPDGWTQSKGNVTKYAPGCSGNFAVRIQNPSSGDIGAITIGYVGDGVIGGVPFNARPDTMVGCFKYDIDVNDTAWAVLILKKAGAVISLNINKIAGNSGGNFITCKFPVHYDTPDIPDSLMMILSSSNMDHKTPSPNSWLIADNISFTGTSLNIPNNSFEQWHTEKYIVLNNWFYKNRGMTPPDSITMGLNRTNDAESKEYAIKLKTDTSPEFQLDGVLKSGNYFSDKIPMNSRHQTFTGYYKYFPANNDTMKISITMFKNGDTIGSGKVNQENTIGIYTPFTVNIAYTTPTEIPDSASILIQTYDSWSTRRNSVLYIDNLNFDGFLSGVKDPVMIDAGNIDFNVFPNPFIDKATVSFTLEKDENVMVRLFELTGKQVALLANGKFTTGNHLINLSALGLQKGFYVCVINTKSSCSSKKVVIY